MRDDLRLDGVGRRYGLRGPWVLRGVDLAIRPGTLTRVEGANGTGKSTLLRLLARVDAPTEGRVTGRPRTAYVPERFPAALPFTAAGYLTHLGAVHGLSRPAAARAAGEWLERFGAAAHAASPMTALSKGSSQKVAVAQALLAAPELLVLDEAWTGLDAGARAELERAVAEQIAGGGAVVFVDHDPHRLAGASGVTYTVRDGALERRTESDSPAPSGPHVLVEAQGPPDGRLPVAGHPGVTSAEEIAPGTHRLAVRASHSDVVLRALLTARPPWHVARVTAHPADAGARRAAHGSGPDHPGPDHPGPDQSGPDQSGPDHSGPGPSVSDRSGPDQESPR
nr:ATP-binding cassette domain-containing protein [Streptomyces sp. MK7]